MELRSRKKSNNPSTEKATPSKRQPVAPKSSLLFKPFGLFDVFQFLIVSIVLASIVSYLTTETLFYRYEFPNLMELKDSYFPKPVTLRNFTLEELAEFDGADGKPIYLAIKGKVYDVTSKPTAYGPKGGYKAFAAKDATRAYGTGCFKDHLTHDVRELTDDQIKAIDDWVSFYEKHKEYTFLGHVKLPKPTGPIPKDCNEEQPEEK